MSFELYLDKLKERKVLSTGLILLTLAVGILLGTLISTGVNAARQGAAAPDATPLVIPDPAPVSNTFAQIAKRISPAVVNINSESVVRAPVSNRPRRPSRSQEEEEDPREDLFRRFFSPRVPGTDVQPFEFGDQRVRNLGSGVIVDPKGYILTNYHVIQDADRVRVKLKDDTNLYDAKIIGSDTETDLAVIKIDIKKPLTHARIGNSEAVQVGDWAIAIGSPFSFEQTMTAGIISAKGRQSPFVSRAGNARQFQRFIQTDAAINQGNSGGPLLNINGEVIGINTAIVSTSGGYEGIGFALPSNIAADVYNRIIKEGKVVRGSIGITFRDEHEATLRVYGAKNGGVLVSDVKAGGPADKAGIKVEDVITALDAKPVRNGEDLVATIATTPVGTRIKVTALREGKPLELTVTVADRAEIFKEELSGEVREEREEPRAGAETTKFGISVSNLTAQDRARLDFQEPGGVLVTKVEQSSFGEDIGLLANDVIVSINRRTVSGTQDVRQIQREIQPGGDVVLRVMRRVPDGRRRVWRAFFLAGVLPPER